MMRRTETVGRESARQTDPSGRESATNLGEGSEALRCDCGRLLARIINTAVELKCARCKRVVIVVDGRRFEESGAGRCDCRDAPATKRGN